MIPQRVEQQPGFVLHRREYGNSSLIYDFLSRDFGRISLLHKGIKNARRQSSIQAFAPVSVNFLGRSELKTLTHCESAASILETRYFATGLYINELIRRFLPAQDGLNGLFESYIEVLKQIGQGRGEEALRYFEMELLQSLGFLPAVDMDAHSGEVVIATQYYDYIGEQGMVKTVAGNNSISGETLLALAQYQLQSQHLASVKRLMRSVIEIQSSGQPLFTRRIMQQWQRHKIQRKSL